MGKVEPWCKACGEGELPSELQDLEDTIHHHQGLYEHITTAYSEVSTHIHAHILEERKCVCEGGKVVLISLRIIFAFTSPWQVSQDGKSLLDKLQRPLTPGSADSLMASANYSKAVHHVLDIIHEVLHHQRQLENIWQHRKVRLHQRLQLCVFQQDVQQVRHKIRPAEGSTFCSWANSYSQRLGTSALYFQIACSLNILKRHL